jgi:chemotaxis response regulator CheB
MLRTILLADDNDAIRTALRVPVAKEENLRVCGEAVDGLDVIEKTKKLRPDLVLLDVSMPKLNGVAAADQADTGAHQMRSERVTTIPHAG